MRDIDLLKQDIRCCDEIMIMDDGSRQLEFAWECWFDVDAYFGTDTQHGDEVWLDFLTYWGRFDNQISAFYVLASDEGRKRCEWLLTDEEKAFLRQKMEQYAGGNLAEYYDEADQEVNFADWEVESGRDFRLKTDFKDYSGYNGSTVTIVRPVDNTDFVRADKIRSLFVAKTSDETEIIVSVEELEKF